MGINWSSKLDLNARVFELAAMGITAVENTVPDMKTFFVPNEHYLEFANVDEAVNKVMLALAGKYEGIADAAWRKVKPHTYDARVQTILERVGLV